MTWQIPTAPTTGHTLVCSRVSSSRPAIRMAPRQNEFTLALNIRRRLVLRILEGSRALEAGHRVRRRSDAIEASLRIWSRLKGDHGDRSDHGIERSGYSTKDCRRCHRPMGPRLQEEVRN